MRLGIFGGTSPESTIHYYEQINRKIRQSAGGNTSADMMLRSVDFGAYCQMMDAGDWDKIEGLLANELLHLAIKDECDFVAIATNTLHKVANKAERILAQYGKPLIHIGDCIADECKAAGYKRVALLGTKVTMTEDFLKERLRQNGLEVVGEFYESEIDDLNRIIFDELCCGEVKIESQMKFLDIIHRADGVDFENGGGGFDAIILGCTELGMLLQDRQNFTIARPKYDHHYGFVDSTQAHINKLVEMYLK